MFVATDFYEITLLNVFSLCKLIQWLILIRKLKPLYPIYSFPDLLYDLRTLVIICLRHTSDQPVIEKNHFVQ